MRKSLILIILIFLSIIAYPQTDGYKDLKLGEKFNIDNISKSYKITQVANDAFHLISFATQKFCELEISYIEIKLSEDTTISLVQVYTNETIYNDWEKFIKDYKTVAECIVNTVGKASYYDPGTNREDGLITTAWAFDNQKHLLGLYGNCLTVSEHKVPRHFLISWIQSNGATKMW